MPINNYNIEDPLYSFEDRVNEPKVSFILIREIIEVLSKHKIQLQKYNNKNLFCTKCYWHHWIRLLLILVTLILACIFYCFL